MKESSFGIVPLYKHHNSVDVLIVQHNAGHWGFPKGHAEINETPLQTATRELEEETGITDIAIHTDTSFSEYYEYKYKGEPREKTVTYFPGFVKNTSITILEKELLDAQWVPLSDAKNLLTHSNVQAIADQVQVWIQKQ